MCLGVAGHSRTHIWAMPYRNSSEFFPRSRIYCDPRINAAPSALRARPSRHPRAAVPRLLAPARPSETSSTPAGHPASPSLAVAGPLPSCACGLLRAECCWPDPEFRSSPGASCLKNRQLSFPHPTDTNNNSVGSTLDLLSRTANAPFPFPLLYLDLN